MTQTETKGREIIQTRILNAPRTLVWQMFTDPKHLVQWWGPKGFTNTFHEHSAKVGGVWRFMMHGPDGADWPNRIQYHELVPNERIAYGHGSDDEPDQFEVEITFEDLGGKTGLTMRTIFPSVEACEAVKAFGAVELGAQTIDKLEKELALMQGLPPVHSLFTLTRTFKAPLAKVWQAFTDPKHLARWWGPAGLGLEVISMNLRPAGIFHYAMVLPNGDKMYGRFLYREIDEQAGRVVFVNSFADADGEVAPMPYFQPFPDEILNTWTLTTQPDGTTLLTIKGGPINASAEEQKAYDDLKPSMEQGFGGTFGQLDAYLEKM